MPGFYLIPYWTCFAKKTAKVPPLPIWQKFMMLNPLSFYGDYSTTTLWMNSSFICFLILPEKGIPYRIFFLPGNGSCIKSQLFPTVSAALFTVIHAGCNSEWVDFSFRISIKRQEYREKIHHKSPANMQRASRTGITVAENKSRYTVPQDEKIRFAIDWKHE